MNIVNREVDKKNKQQEEVMVLTIEELLEAIQKMKMGKESIWS